MRYLMVLIVLAAQVGCATVDFTRKVYDQSGRELGTFTIKHGMTTAEGAAILMEGARRLRETEQDGDADVRVADIAKTSIRKGQHTSVTTRGGQVSSGYIGYDGQYGYSPYGRFGYGSSQYYPGASPDMIEIEQAWHQQRGFMLPPLSEGTVPYPPSMQPMVPADGAGSPPLARAECPQGRPPANLAEEIACTQRDVHALIRVHAPPVRKAK